MLPAAWGYDQAASKEDPNYQISPSTVIRGKDYNVVVRPRADCTEGPSAPLKGVHVDLAGVSGIKATDMGSDMGCFLRFKISVADDAPLGSLNVPLIKSAEKDKPCSNGSGTVCTVAVLSLNVASVDRGALPPGLEPQADITWKVLPRRAASDSFGRAFINRYFAIEVTVGNNTGYDLQISSLAFVPPMAHAFDAPVPSDAYNVGRSTLEREQEVGRRTLLVNTIKALGSVMTGGSAFFFNTGPKARWDASISLFSGPFEKGVELIYPDKTVRQLNALDNRALRDSAIIPNNISQRLLVFMSRELVECKPGHSSTGCAWCSSGSSSSDDRLEYKKDFNPDEVMRRLGTLVVVGKNIQYLNRVRVVSTPQPVVVPPPVVQPSSELTITQGEQNKVFSLTGIGLRGAGIAVEAGVSKLRITDIAPNPDGTHVDFKASAEVDCPPKKYKLYAAAPSGTQTMEIEVTAHAPQPDKSTDQKSNPDPASLSQGVSKNTIKIKGQFLDNSTAAFPGDDAKKLTIVETDAPKPGDGSQPQTLALTITVESDAKPGTYRLQLTRFEKTADLDLKIKGLKPTVDSPLQVEGKNSGSKPFEFKIKGSNLATAEVKAPEGSAIQVKVTSKAKEELTCQVDTSKAKAGETFELTISNGEETADKTITFKVAS